MVTYAEESPLELVYERSPAFRPATKELVGVDIFVHEDNRSPAFLGDLMLTAAREIPLDLQMITNRGVKVWPGGKSETFCTDHWRCRFIARNGGVSNLSVIWMLLRSLAQKKIDVVKMENLYTFDGEKGFSMGQGQS